MTVNIAMDFTDTNFKYKVYPRGTLTNATTASGTLYGASAATSTGTTTLTITTLVTGSFFMPGSYIYAPAGTGTATTNVPAGTYIVNQLFGSSASITYTTTGTATQNTNVITMTANPANVTVGMLVQNAASTAFSYGPASTYVVAVNNSTNTITLSNNITAAGGIPNATALYFIAPGGAGNYTTNQATTITATALAVSSILGNSTNWYWDLGCNNLNSTTNTPYMYQTSALDNIWIGDEVRTINFSSFGGGATTANTALYAYTTDYAGYGATAIGAVRQVVFAIPFKRDDSYINGNPYGTLTTFTTDFRVGDDIIIDGTECTITQIVSDSQLRINMDFTHSTAQSTANANGSATSSATTTTTYSSGGAAGATTVTMTGATGVVQGQLITGAGLPQGTYVVSIATNTFTLSKAFNTQATGTYSFWNGTNIWKKLKLHGYTLEGTREGGTGLLANSAIVTATTSNTAVLTLTVSSLTNGTGTIITPGMQVLPSATPYASTVPGLVYITNQQLATGASITTTTAAIATAGQNAIVLTSVTSIAVGYIIQSATSTALTNVPSSTYVIAINTTTNTILLNNNLLTQLASGSTVYFAAAGGNGVYTTSAATTLSATATSFYTPTTGKFTNGTSILATAGTVYPIGTYQLTLAASTVTGQGQYNFIKISGAGGPPQVLTGQVTSYVSTYVTGINTLFTTQLHIGAEIIIAGQYLTVVAINSDTQLIVAQNSGTAGVVNTLTPIYRSVPLYTQISSAAGAAITLLTPIKNNLYVGAANPPMVYIPSTGADFLEYVYSAPNYSAEQSTTAVLNTSLDRKYFGFRIWPLYQGTNAAPTGLSPLSTAQGAYSLPVYERWTASWAQSHGVGINQADLSGGTMVWGSQTTTALSVLMPVCGSVNLQMGFQGLASGVPNVNTTGLVLAGGTLGMAAATYTVTTGTITGPAPIVASLYGVYDINCLTEVVGGTIFLFANKRYFAIQGRSSSNQQTQWLGCIEFERAQPEDLGTGTAAGSGLTFGGTIYGGSQLAAGASPATVALPGFSQVLQYTAGTAPYPTFGYFNGNRMPTGAQQIPTLPAATTGTSYPIHGCVLACPRIRNQVGDLVGFNANIYSALTITTGRWGHVVEMGNYSSYAPAYLGNSPTVSTAILTNIANTIPQIHMGQIVPVYTNIYNSKRFMFSPVVVLGPTYDPDVRGRLFGLKVLPSALGTLMDTVSITVDSNYFYSTNFAASDHWVIGSPPATSLSTAFPGQQTVVTNRFTLTQNAGGITQSWRSLEDSAGSATNAAGLFTNNFRFALPA